MCTKSARPQKLTPSSTEEKAQPAPQSLLGQKGLNLLNPDMQVGKPTFKSLIKGPAQTT